MSVANRNPLRMAGATLGSGNPATGEVHWTRGGVQKWGAYSGGILSLGSGSPNPATGAITVTGDHARVYLGAGRLHTVMPNVAISGVSLIVYDSSVVARSGPGTFQESGYGVIAALPPNTWHPGGGTLLGIQPPIAFDVPFHSGLCVAGTSGVPSFTLTFTPEVAQSGTAPVPG